MVEETKQQEWRCPKCGAQGTGIAAVFTYQDKGDSERILARVCFLCWAEHIKAHVPEVEPVEPKEEEEGT